MMDERWPAAAAIPDKCSLIKKLKNKYVMSLITFLKDQSTIAFFKTQKGKLLSGLCKNGKLK
jgi:hypothetical protein